MHKIVKGENGNQWKISAQKVNILKHKYQKDFFFSPLINQIEHIKILLRWFHIQFWANIKFHDIQVYLILLQSIEYNGKC